MTTLMATEVWDVPAGAGVAAIAAAIAGLAVIAWLWTTTAPRRVTAGPATMELRDEPPALVDLLVGGFEVEDDAVPATLVDLAARRHLDIDEAGGRITLRLRRHGSQAGEQLTDFEQRVVRHLERHADDDGVIPAEVITLGPEGVSERWFRGFVREVNRHGQQLGLCRRRFDLKHIAFVWIAVVVGIAPAWVVASAAPRTDDPTDWGSLGNVLVGVAFLIGAGLIWVAQSVTRSNAQTDTDAGREAAAHWLGVRDHYRTVGDFDDKSAASVAIWDEHLAYATAMGLAPVVQRQLPFETEHDRHAWSRASGDWRRVKVRYRAYVPSWGEHPGRVAFGGLVQMVLFGFLAYLGLAIASEDLTDTDDQIADVLGDNSQYVNLAGLVLAIGASALAILAAARLVLGVSDLFARETIEGEAVRVREFREGDRLPKVVQWAIYSRRDDHTHQRRHRKVTRYVAIDPGEGDQIVAHEVSQGVFRQVRQGSRVRAVVTPRLGYVKSIETLAPPRASAASERAVPHELAGEVTNRVTSAVTGQVTAALEGAEQLRDDQGRPVMDVPDDDGVTLRERLAEASGELDRVRNDPRLRNSPVAGLLDSLLGGASADDASADRRSDPTDRDPTVED